MIDKSTMPFAPSRRHLCLAGLAAAAGAVMAPSARGAVSADPTRLASLLRDGGVVVALRHALAPGVYDPPGFRLGECKTQRNLNEEGRAQAASLGDWFRSRQLVPARVRSSPWCRCLDTAQAAFGLAESWDALGSPASAEPALREARSAALRAALHQVPAGRFEAWVTHQFVLQDLAGEATAPAEALLLRAARGPAGVEVLARASLY